MKISRIITLIAVVLLTNLFAFAQQYADYIRKPLQFTTAQRSITVKATVTADKLIICHSFKAKKNQRLTAHISSDNNRSRFEISAQEGSDIPLTETADGEFLVYDYSDLIPTTETYEICVRSNRGRSNYTLNVTLK